MTDTTVVMTSTTIALPNGSSVYQIDAEVTVKGDLLYPNIFVFQILDPLDTTRDTFVRVGTPYDLENIPLTRVAAIAASQEYFLSSTLQRRYSDLNTAVQAKDAVRSRIDNCVQAWQTYSTDFSGTDTNYHPTAEATYEQQLKDDYVDARDARVAADEAVALADAALVLAQDAVQDAVAISGIYRADLNFTEQSYVIYWAHYYLAATTFRSDMVNRFTAFKADFLAITGEVYTSSGVIAGLSTEEETWLTHLRSMETNIASMDAAAGDGTALESAFGNFHASVGGLYTTQQGVIATANVTAANAVTAKKEAEASLASAQLAEDAALAAVLAVCPEFDPSSV
jgi:hypothetical protein